MQFHSGSKNRGGDPLWVCCFSLNLHVMPRDVRLTSTRYNLCEANFLFPLSGGHNKLIPIQLSWPSSPLQSAHSETCLCAWRQQRLISSEHSFDFGSMIGPSGLSDPFSGSVQVEHPQENLPLPFLGAKFQTHLYFCSHVVHVRIKCGCL